MKQTLKIIALSALATAAVIKAVPAFSEPVPADVRVSVVRTADLDLSTAEGQRRFEQRLVAAAHELCDTASAADLKAMNAQAECRATVLSQGRDKARLIAAVKSGASITLAASD